METRISNTPLEGLVVVDVAYFSDERGFFIENYHKRDFASAGIMDEFVQDNHSRSGARVLRGFHYQDMTAPMAKLVRCTVGEILDVAVDLRVGSPTFAQWYGVALSAENQRQIFVPAGFGHAFLTVSPVAEVQYKCTGFYTPSSEGTVAWNDPEIGVDWPVKDPVLSNRDKNGLSLREYLKKPAFYYER